MTSSAPQLNTLYLYLTEGCNCACQHCWIVSDKSKLLQDKSFLSLAALERAIEQALPLGLTTLKWTGGEPTLHPQFAEFLKLQKSFGLDALIETNGMLVSREMAKLMRDVGVSEVSVSLDGARSATHDEIRGVTGGFEKTLQGIKALVAEGYRPELILTLQRSNFQELAEYLALAEELGAGSVKLNILQPVLRGKELMAKGRALEIEEILEIRELMRTEKLYSSDLPVKLDLPLAFRPLSGILSGQQDGSCGIFNILGVLPRGDYALCGVGQNVPELAMGDILSVALDEVWDTHPVLEKLRDGLPNRMQGICSRCLMRSACLGSCVAANYQLSGDLLAPYWFCREADEKGLFPASRQV